jgi:hypothetical protein
MLLIQRGMQNAVAGETVLVYVSPLKRCRNDIASTSKREDGMLGFGDQRYTTINTPRCTKHPHILVKPRRVVVHPARFRIGRQMLATTQRDRR